MIRKILGLNFISLFIIVSTAHAYLDPGTGSIILQGLIAALAAGVVFIKMSWYKLLILLGIKKKDNNDSKQNFKKNKIK